MKEHKIGDIIMFEQCWEDESGAYHDEGAELLAINSDGTLKLKWLVDNTKVKKFLDDCTYTVEDLEFAY